MSLHISHRSIFRVARGRRDSTSTWSRIGMVCLASFLRRNRSIVHKRHGSFYGVDRSTTLQWALGLSHSYNV